MKLAFEKITINEKEKILSVCEIINDNGKHMFKEEGLTHWLRPYTIDDIKGNMQEVFLVKDINTNKYIHTFQLEFRNDLPSSTDDSNKCIKVVTINKFATLPEASGKGIGKLSLDYIEKYCISKGILKICLDVYDQSKHAIQFYKNRGFIIVGSKPTKHFTVYLMEKKLQF